MKDSILMDTRCVFRISKFHKLIFFKLFSHASRTRILLSPHLPYWPKTIRELLMEFALIL